MRDEIAQILLGEIDVQITRLESLDKQIPEMVRNAVSALNVAVKTERESAAKIALTISAAQKQILAAAQAASNAELMNMQKRMYKVMEEVSLQIREESAAPSPSAWKIKVSLALSCVLLLGGLAGSIIGAARYGKSLALTAEQAQQLSMGKALMEILPQLDKATKDKLVHQLEKNMH